jgi:5-methylcytosine-specific restriction endonuclease McrA
MSNWIDIKKDPRHGAKEKEKAKELKKSAWWKNILAQGHCHYCEKNFNPDALTMDHVVPLSRGGRSVKSNVVPSCLACNRKKKYLTPVDMILEGMKKLT